MAQSRSIIFDVDSTLVTIEALDFLAARNGCARQVAALTTKAMNGQLPYHQSLRQKLALVRPSFSDLVWQGNAYLHHLTFGVPETLAWLRRRGHPVWLLTGSFQPAVGILAHYLKIPDSQVFTNEILFDSAGGYIGFNASHPLAHNHGKAILLHTLKDRLTDPVFIGDGATDLEAQSQVSLFIGFGGVVYRPRIAAKASIYITEPDLSAILQKLYP